MNQLYIGFIKDDVLYGCYYEIHLDSKKKSVSEELKELFNKRSIKDFAQNFKDIHWKIFDKETDALNGSLLFQFLKIGNIEGYKEYLRKTYEVLGKNGFEDEEGKLQPIDFTSDLDKMFKSNQAVICNNPIKQEALQHIESYIIDLDNQKFIINEQVKTA